MRTGVKQKKAAGTKARPAPKSVADLPLDRSVGYQVRATNRAFQTRLREQVERFGVSPGMWYFLRLLWQEDGVTQRDLSRRIGLMEPTAFTALSAMERCDLVTRGKDPKDARKIEVRLTKHGRSLREQMLPLAHDINAEGLRGLTKAEIATLLTLLKKIEANLMAQSRRGPQPKSVTRR